VTEDRRGGSKKGTKMTLQNHRFIILSYSSTVALSHALYKTVLQFDHNNKMYSAVCGFTRRK